MPFIQFGLPPFFGLAPGFGLTLKLLPVALDRIPIHFTILVCGENTCLDGYFDFDWLLPWASLEASCAFPDASCAFVE